MTLKICFVGDLGSIHTIRWVQYFAEHGVETHVLSVGGPSAGPLPAGVVVHEFRAPRAKVRAVSFAMAGLTVLPRIWRAKKIFRQINPDMVHVHYISDHALITALTGFQPLVVTAWGSDVLVGPKKNPFLKWLVRYVTKRAKLITCDAEHMKTALVNLGVPAAKVEVIFFGTNTDKFNPGMRDEKVRRELGGDNRAQVVISLRRLEPIYDIPTLISAVPHVLKELPHTRFVIAGSGSLLDSLKSQASSLGVTHAINFLGQLKEETLASVVASSDAYVSTSLSDAGLSASTAEAMSSEVPVIISDVKDNGQWVENGVSGFLYKASDPESLAGCIVMVLKDSELHRRLGQNGRHVISERNSLAGQMRRMHNLYEKLADGKTDGPRTGATR